MECKGKKGGRDEPKTVDGGRKCLKEDKGTWVLIFGPASNLPHDPILLCVLEDKFFKWD